MRVFKSRFVAAALVCATALCGCTSHRVSFSPPADRSSSPCDGSSCIVEPTFAPGDDNATNAVLTYRIFFHGGGKFSRLSGERKCESTLKVELYVEPLDGEVLNTDNFRCACGVGAGNSGILAGRVERVRLVSGPDGSEGMEVSLRATFVERVPAGQSENVWSFELSGVPGAAPVADTSGSRHPLYSRMHNRGKIVLNAYVTLVYWSDGGYDWYCWNDRVGRHSPLTSRTWSERGASMRPLRDIWNGFKVVCPGDDDGHKKPEEPGIR